MEKTTLRIKGMSCNMCSAAIEEGLEELEGVKKASVSYAKERGIVEYEPELVKLTEIYEKIRDLGYSVDE